ncbi:S1 family peptidase [Catelliglobosispora koreensis]|uniref:S1 family peptidase n=1 Tax=Catelliglobosispora koreensis TaxID=129052 RepID=UPI00037EB8C0|nr:S1 family peptidase [Catelliglobosispora koreensis]
MSSLLVALLLIVTAAVAPARQAAVDPGQLRAQLAAAAPGGSTLRIDHAAGKVVATLGAQPSEEFLSLAAAHPGRVSWHIGSGVRPLITARGGWGLTNPFAAPCTAGFAMKAVNGFNYIVTAGHCVADGMGTQWNLAGYLLGPGHFHSFPGNDYGVIMVAYNSPVTTHPTLINYNGSGVRVLGTNTPTIGQRLCKSGNVSGVTCGTVLALDVTVTYHTGEVVNGLIETAICASPGDSGSPLFRDPGDRRLIGMGVLSGGNGVRCGDPGVRTYYNPLTEIMAAYGLSLIK